MHIMNEICYSLIRISVDIVPKGPIDSRSTLVQEMAWCWTVVKPLPELIMIQFINATMATNE